MNLRLLRILILVSPEPSPINEPVNEPVNLLPITDPVFTMFPPNVTLPPFFWKEIDEPVTSIDEDPVPKVKLVPGVPVILPLKSNIKEAGLTPSPT